MVSCYYCKHKKTSSLGETLCMFSTPSTPFLPYLCPYFFFLSFASFPIPRTASHFSLQPAFPPSLISRSVGLFFMLYSSANNILILPQTVSLWIARLSTLTSKLFNTRIISFYSFLKQNFNIHSEEKVGTNNTDSPGVS